MNINLLNIVRHKFGIDKAIFYTLLSRGLQAITSIFTVFFITKYLSSDEQGYYYTFGSIVAIQIFFELGLTGIITQFVAHEVSHLQLIDNKLIGDKEYKSRLSSLLRFCAKWYCIFAFILLLALMIVGYFFFIHYESSNTSIAWKLPWILLAIGTALNLLIAPIVAFIEGLGKVKEIAKIRFIQQVISPVVVWGGLIIGSKLFVSGANAIIQALIIVIILYKSPFRKILTNIWKDKAEAIIKYTKEIFPYQWRIALSWISGYFIFQLFNPVLFATEGAKVAGQMGMTMAALNAILALSLSWFNTKVPKISGLIAQKKYETLDDLFGKTMKQMLTVGFSCLLLFVIIIFFVQTYDIKFFGLSIADRFLSITPLILMALSIFSLMPINGWAVYLRSHKKEPLMVNSIVVGILCCLSTVLLGRYYGLMGIVVGFCAIRFVSLTWIYSIFKKKKIEWHGK
jgi:O-antigen/teichoic acid export membrane protein